MTILGIDTSSLAASCALWRDGKLVGESFANAGLTHSQTIMPMVRDLLLHTRCPLEEVDGLAVSAGPGSFTGLRIGISAVKGLALGLNRPCAAVSTLEGLARNVGCFSGLVVPVMDARCQQVYTALFQSGAQGLRRIGEDQAVPIAELERQISELGEQPVLLVGDGTDLCMEHLRKIPHLRAAPETLRHQRASSVCLAAQLAGRWIPADALAPAYLRLPQAERERMARLSAAEPGQASAKPHVR